MKGVQSTDFKINYKVFTEADMNRLIEILKKLPNKQSKSKYQEELRIKIQAADGITHELDDTTIDSAKLIFSEKKIVSFEASYVNIKDHSLLSIKISEQKYYTNFVIVKSGKETWFNSYRVKLQDFLNSVRDQDNFYLRNEKLCKIVISYFLGLPLTYLVFTIMNLFLQTSSSSEAIQMSENTRYLLTAFLYVTAYGFMPWFLGTIYLSDRLFSKLEQLWPPIEFNFGPSHLNGPSKSRAVYKYLVSVILIPVMISVAFFLLA